MNSDLDWMAEAALIARKALCLQAKCGSIIVRDDVVLGSGYNAPPRDDCRIRRCGLTVPSTKKPKSDRTCCLHAEWRAILTAKSNNLIEGSTLYFTRVDHQGRALVSGSPYCTVCSRLALDAGVATWVLSHATGLKRYAADEYDWLSHRYDELAT